jgi:hypothetical protein
VLTDHHAISVAFLFRVCTKMKYVHPLITLHVLWIAFILVALVDSIIIEVVDKLEDFDLRKSLFVEVWI